ncbi:MAG: hypothetical protein AUJ49_04210 [Desulfovibrionaceae bacterium CG1_02_65_16]|nr:MAG: hypothetical protein AUJ49_04210 [Desulfovibrionaceae bacterium CG1_02_65_16]
MLLPQTVQGKIDLCRANIANDLTTTGAITLQNCELDLSGAKIGRLCDSEDSWPGPGKLHLDGFEYESIQRAAPTTANARLAWLKRQPEESFQTQPYEQLAAWYHRAGHDSFARDIRIAKERARLRQWLSILSKSYWREVGAKLGIKSKRPGSSAQTASRPWKLYFKEPCKRFWWWVKDIIVGYGYKPHFALIWLAAIWLLGAAVFGHAYPEGMTQSASYKYATPEQNQTDLDNNTQPLGLMLSTNYPAFNPLIYSLDVALPIVDLQQERYWMPNSSVPEGRGLWWFNWFEVLMGWFLASMGIAGATGIIRKD